MSHGVTGHDIELHPWSKVIGIYFLVSNDGIYSKCINLKFSMLRKISWVYVIASCLREHSNLVRFEKHAAKTLQHVYRYGDIGMLYDMITTYELIFLL